MSCTKSPLPTPRFYSQPLSSKKNKPHSYSDRPPPTPRAKIHSSCSSLSHILSKSPDKAKSVSFRESKSSLSSTYDFTSDQLYFHQCFEVISKLGSGSFGEVFKVRCKEDRRYYAVKRAKEKFAGKSDRDRKLQEVQKHEQLPHHPNCVRFYQAWEERQRLYIQTELCCCSLSHYAEENHNIPEAIVWNYLVDLLLAVRHLHSHNLIHLDIKPENIFVSEDGICKLGDFGLVLDVSSTVKDPIEGDPRYLAPELLLGIFTKAADIFSLGITILELSADLFLPAGGETWHQLRQLKIPKEFLKRISPELLVVIRRMMEPDHKERPTVQEVLSMKAVDKKYQTRRKAYKTDKKNASFTSPRNNNSLSSQEWNSSISDDVFDKDPAALHLSSNPCEDNSDSVFHNLSICNNDDKSSPTCYGMSTPNEFKYLEPKVYDMSASPCLPASKKKGISPNGNSPKFTKSPRLRLFDDDPISDTDFFNIPKRSLLNAFNSISSEEESS